MPAPLSDDLRDRIVRAVAGGASARSAAARFDVSPCSAVKLMQRVRATGSARPAKCNAIGNQPLNECPSQANPSLRRHTCPNHRN